MTSTQPITQATARRTRQRISTSAVGIATLSAILAGCGGQGQGAESGAKASSKTSSASTTGSTASSSPSPSETVSRAEADKRGMAGLFPDDAMAKVDFTVEQKRKAGKWEWYQSCTPTLPSDLFILGGAHSRWSDGKRTVDQIVDVYDPGKAKAAVADAKKLTNCGSYVAGNGAKITKITPFELPTVTGVDAQYGWCEAVKEVSQCYAVLAVGDTLTSIWVLSDPVTDTQDALTGFVKLAAARLASQG